jgi:hypothetical protein
VTSASARSSAEVARQGFTVGGKCVNSGSANALPFCPPSEPNSTGSALDIMGEWKQRGRTVGDTFRHGSE